MATVRKPKKADESQAFERALRRKTSAERYVLRLYVTGTTPNSTRAIQNIRAICERELQGRYELEVIDIYQHPELIQREQVVVAPTLVKTLPAPVRRLIGDLSDTEKVLIGLDLRPRKESA
jgi:circadian clock protein KaiB